MYQSFFKRIFDIILCIFLIVILSPLMVIIFFLVSYYIGTPIFYQKRPGLNNKIFEIYKFKTLYDSSEQHIESLRQNKIGDFLRKTGLDELPQLFNILKNEMSFVGPRPLLIEYLEKYSDYEKKRHLVKPGITGLAQVKPNSSGVKSWAKSIRFDIFYVNHVSFLFDMYILYKTAKILILGKKQFQDFKKSL